MFSDPDHSHGVAMTPDQIFITDIGVDNLDRAFFHLALGRHVYDHEWKELKVRDLEEQIDPNDVMNPVLLRGALWKKVPPSLWQVDDGHQLGPLPSQAGLNSHVSSVYYADRRARQAAHSMQSPSTSVPTGDQHASASLEYIEKPLMYTPIPCAANVQWARSRSYSYSTPNRSIETQIALRNPRSHSDIKAISHTVKWDPSARDDEYNDVPDNKRMLKSQDEDCEWLLLRQDSGLGVGSPNQPDDSK